jgi:LacI family transcriptional regulator/LacI family repressor for deo operon, udp, cdd, tsx, nupC, and nupG
LIEKGYKKIGFLGGGLNFHIGNLRYQGFVDTLKKHGIEQQDKWVVKSDELFFNACPVIQKFLLKKDRPDALFTMSDGIGIEDLAFLAYEASRQNGIVVPALLDDYIKSLLNLEVIEQTTPKVDAAHTATD